MAFIQSQHLWVNQQDDGIAELRFGGSGERYTLLDKQVLAELEEALDKIVAAGKFRLLLIHLGRSGSAGLGMDLDHLASFGKPEDSQDLARAGQRVCRRLAELPLPSVALIAGSCLGPELQLALACDYRALVDRPGTVVGFPELEVGLLPFWGGTQRLPRLVGLERALKMLLLGRRYRPAEALQLGLADAVTGEGSEPPTFLAAPEKKQRSWLPLSTWRQRLVESHAWGRWLIFKGIERLLRRRSPQDMPAPWKIVAAVREGLKRGALAGEEAEVRFLGQLVEGPAWKHLLNLHRRREAIRAELVPRDRKERVRRLGIVGGAGRGSALVVLAATRNCHVVLKEEDDLTMGFALMGIVGQFQGEVNRGTMTQADFRRNLSAIHGTSAWRDFQDLDLVLLGRDEPPEKVRSTLAEVEKHVGPQTLIVSTDPAMPVAELQDSVRRPEHLAAVHFQTPAGRSLLVEVVPAATMTADNVRRLLEWVAHLGRTPRQVPDGPGFLWNRLLLPYLVEAVLLVEEGVRIDRIDQAMVHFGMAHGPLEHLDLLGIDQALQIARALEGEWAGRIPAGDALALSAQHGWLGQKTGLGFYRYRRRPVMHYRLMNELRQQGRQRRAEHLDVLSFGDQKRKVTERLVFLWINESARYLDQTGMDPAELDLTLSLGGWAPHRGGPWAYARQLGREKVLETLEFLSQHHGERYRAYDALKEWW